MARSLKPAGCSPKRGDLYFNIGYADTNFGEFVTGGGSNDFSDNEFANAPKLTAAVGGYLQAGDFAFGVEASYRDSYYSNITNTFTVDSLIQVNLSVTYEQGDLSLKLYANNLFDRVTALWESLEVEGQRLGLLSEPRTVGVRASYQF